MDDFFASPVLTSPYDYPRRHWELDRSGQPTGHVIEQRRRAEFITPIPKPRKRRLEQGVLVFDEGHGLSTSNQQYDPTPIINLLRSRVDQWREIKNPSQWRVTGETARLLQHWRHHKFESFRPFFCQVEAVETAIWLTEVAPTLGKEGRVFLDHLNASNEQFNPGVSRLALKLATGAGKTTVMAMLIAWQTINAVRRPSTKRFTRGFLIVTPGLTIRDRLRVLYPNDPDSYFRTRELVPADLLPDLDRAKIVITNRHAFKLREVVELSKGGRSLLQGRGEPLQTAETDGQMVQRIMPELMGLRNIMAINDEAHHCYRQKPGEPQDGDLSGEERKEAERNSETARQWMSGLEAVQRKLGLQRVVDLSATPFFLRGSGYPEGTLFPWTMSDFSLMDAIESGIVKLPRVPVADNIPGEEMPRFRDLWAHIGKKMPKKGRGSGAALDPLAIPVDLQAALDALYGHYEKTFELWAHSRVLVPPCFIIVCNNTATSKLVYDYVSGFHQRNDDGTASTLINGRLPLFRNYADDGTPLARPHTLLIDSEQIDSGEGLDAAFRAAAGDEVERFRREIVHRTGDRSAADNLSDEDLLREVMNTVGKPGRLGSSIRCVVSVAMLTEGWDANTVTHVLGLRAFGTQLLCEQVIGRALRRQSYELNDRGLLAVEYADVLGIPFDFAAKPTVAPPQEARDTVHVRAISPARDMCEVLFPRVEGYRVELPEEGLSARFDADSTLVLTPDQVGPSVTENRGIVGEGVDLNLVHTANVRRAAIVFHLARRLLLTKWRDTGGAPKVHLFGQLKRITELWLDGHLECQGGTYPAQLLYQELADIACDRITRGIVTSLIGSQPVKAILDPYNPTGSTLHVNFNTSSRTRWETDPRRCHINWAVCDSDWEVEFCRAVERHPRVVAYAKNHNLGFEIPYRHGSEARRYRPDFIVLIDDGHGPADLLRLIVEIKGFRGEDAKEKKATAETFWVPGVNRLAAFGRWSFLELREVYKIQGDFEATVARALDDAFSLTSLRAANDRIASSVSLATASNDHHI